MSYKLQVYLMAILAIAMFKLVCGVRRSAGSGLHSAPYVFQEDPKRGTP